MTQLETKTSYLRQDVENHLIKYKSGLTFELLGVVMLEKMVVELKSLRKAINEAICKSKISWAELLFKQFFLQNEEGEIIERITFSSGSNDDGWTAPFRIFYENRNGEVSEVAPELEETTT